MKYSEIKKLTLEELKDKLKEHKSVYRKNFILHSITKIDNPMILRKERKIIAKIKTELRSKELSNNNNKKNEEKS